MTKIIHGQLPKIVNVSFQLADEEHMHLPAFDNTKLVALNTCPTWGVIRYGLHRRMPGSGRAMPLEAGSAMHEVFAYIRLCQLYSQLANGPLLADHHGMRLFGDERWQTVFDGDTVLQDRTQAAKMGALKVLETGGFYDDPSDKRRTLSNLEECAFAYIDRWQWQHDVWIRDLDDPKSDVGIEIAYNLLVDIELETGEHVVTRHTGIIDGIHVHEEATRKIKLHENKTASRLNDAWSMPFALATQVTGYCIAASTFTGEDIREAVVHGLSIPLPRSYDFGGIVREHASRKNYHFERWIQWYYQNVMMYNQYIDNPLAAPQYTHSCGRYFRPCAFIPLCDADDDERQITLDQMVTDVWSPLESKAGE